MISGIKYIDEEPIKNKNILLRVDYNVPIDETGIVDDRRIRATLQTINYLLDEKNRVIILSHMGRPKGKRIERLSLQQVAKRLSRLLMREVLFVPDCIGEEVKLAIKKNYDVILLENVRFYEEETKGSLEFAKKIKEDTETEVYVNDAFAVSHRKHTSVYILPTLYEKKYAGLLMKKELMMLGRIMKEEELKRPFCAVIGGAKIADKIGAMKNLVDKVDKLIIGGAMAFTFLESFGVKTGKSLVEKEYIKTAEEILEYATKKKVKVYLPVDCVVAESPEKDTPEIVPVQEIPQNKMALDIGPATIILFQEALRDAKTIVWNGPMGYFEAETFAKGTYSMVSILANSRAFTIVGGGDTDVAVLKLGEQHRISYISTGGGAFVEFLEKETLPGIEILNS